MLLAMPLSAHSGVRGADVAESTSPHWSAPVLTAQVTGPAAKPKRPRRRLRTAGILLVVFGLAGAGGVGGWFARGHFALPKRPPLIDARVNRPVTKVDSVGTGIMPSVIGLTSDQATRALFDAGL